MSDSLYAQLNKFLATHKEFSNCIIMSPHDGGQNDEDENNIITTLGDLTHFYNYFIVPSHPEKPMLPPLPQFLPSHALYLIHQHFYLQDKLYRERCKSFKQSIEKMDELIDILIEISKKQSFRFSFSKTSIQWNLLADNIQAIRISSKDSFTVAQLSIHSQLIDNNSIDNEIINILKRMIQNVDRSLSTFPDSELQEELEQIFNYPPFYFCQEFHDLCNATKYKTPKSFVNDVLSLMNKILKYLKLKTHDEVFIFSIAFFRIIFNKAYPTNVKFFKYPTDTKFRNIDSKLTLSAIGAPMNLLQGYSPNDHPRTVAKNVPEIQQAAQILTTAAFITSPLDVLLIIHNALLILKKYAAKVSDFDTSSAFESIFGLFMLTLVASDLPSPQETFAFAVEFSPATGLSGVLEYDKATATAANIQCDALVVQFTN